MASACAGSGGKEAGEEAEENDPLHMQASNAVHMLIKYFEQIDFATVDNNMHQTAVTTFIFAKRSKK